jgi:beta-1,4-N-acetylglucosaminyltransferase
VILGTVGTHTAPFDRMIKALDDFARTTSEEVIIQIGTSRLEPQCANWFQMTDSVTFLGYLQTARLVVAPPSDTLLEAIRLRRAVVATPRLRRFREVIDDHQLELGRELSQRYGLPLVEDMGRLAAAILLNPRPVAGSSARPEQALVDALRGDIRSLGRPG